MKQSARLLKRVEVMQTWRSEGVMGNTQRVHREGRAYQHDKQPHAKSRKLVGLQTEQLAY
eukprot:5885751-Amphidinium_carterae.1